MRSQMRRHLRSDARSWIVSVATVTMGAPRRRRRSARRARRGGGDKVPSPNGFCDRQRHGWDKDHLVLTWLDTSKAYG